MLFLPEAIQHIQPLNSGTRTFGCLCLTHNPFQVKKINSHLDNQRHLKQSERGFPPPYLFQLLFHAWCQHNAGKHSTEEEEEGIDKTCHCRILAVGATSAQQTRGTAAQTGNLKGRDRNSKGIPLSADTGALGDTERKTRAPFRDTPLPERTDKPLIGVRD